MKITTGSRPGQSSACPDANIRSSFKDAVWGPDWGWVDVAPCLPGALLTLTQRRRGPPAPPLRQGWPPCHTPLSRRLNGNPLGRLQDGSLAVRGNVQCGPVRCPCSQGGRGPGYPGSVLCTERALAEHWDLPEGVKSRSASPHQTRLPLRGPLAKILECVFCQELQTVPSLGPLTALRSCSSAPRPLRTCRRR